MSSLYLGWWHFWFWCVMIDFSASVGLVWWLRLELFGKVIEANPALSILNIVELLKDLFFGVACRLHGPPEVSELLKGHLPIIVHINLGEEFFGWYFAKGSLPVLQGLLLINVLTVVDVKNGEDFVHLLTASSWELRKVGLYLTKKCHMQSCYIKKTTYDFNQRQRAWCWKCWNIELLRESKQIPKSD